jgi:hypothetical protein
VLLHVDSDVLAERINADEALAVARQWRLDHISDYEKARPWMESAADLVLDATRLPAAEVAERIAVEAERRMADAPSLCSGICLHAVAERAGWLSNRYSRPACRGRHAPPQPVLERARGRVHRPRGGVDGFDLPHGTSTWTRPHAPEWPGLLSEELRLRRAEEDFRTRQGHAGQRIAAVRRRLQLKLPAGAAEGGRCPVWVLGCQDHSQQDSRLSALSFQTGKEDLGTETVELRPWN